MSFPWWSDAWSGYMTCFLKARLPACRHCPLLWCWAWASCLSHRSAFQGGAWGALRARRQEAWRTSWEKTRYGWGGEELSAPFLSPHSPKTVVGNLWKKREGEVCQSPLGTLWSPSLSWTEWEIDLKLPFAFQVTLVLAGQRNEKPIIWHQFCVLGTLVSFYRRLSGSINHLYYLTEVGISDTSNLGVPLYI